jgi:hypothetical protein
VTREIRKLETRVQGIETQVQEIRRRGESKGARRRAHRNRSVGAGATTTDDETAAESTAAASEVEAATVPGDDDKAGAGENGHHAAVAATPGARAATDEDDDDDVEYIPRPHASRAQVQPPQRAITLSGSYRLPLPASVSEREMRAVQRGIAGVQNIARRVLVGASAGDGNAAAAASSRGDVATQSGGGWSAWLGAYSVSVARMVREGELSGRVEGPVVGERPSVRWAAVEEVGGSERRRPRKLRVRGTEDAGASRLDGTSAESLLA